MVADPGEHVSKPSLRIEGVALGSHDQRIHCCGTLSAAIGAGEQPRLASQCHHPFILPMSVKSWKSITDGIPIFGTRCLFDA
jgi:hypothetical protein